MHIALASNEVYSPGLLCAILSILAATDGRRGITFHILDGGLEQTTWEILEKKVSLFSRDINLKRHPLSLEVFSDLPLEWEGLPSGFGDGAMAYARLLLPSLIDEDEVIFVDTDMLFFRDLQSVWKEPLDDKLVAACQDFNVKYLANDSVFDLTAEEADLWYFSAGFMKVNLKLWREEDVQGQTFRLLRDHGSKCKWVDQTALNACLKGRVKYLDRCWNRFSMETLSLADFAVGGINIHYIAHPKPWVRYEIKNVSYLIWRMFRAKWMPTIGRPAHKLQGMIEDCCDALAQGASWRGIGADITGLFCGFLNCVIWMPGARVVDRWLRRQRTKLEIIRCAKDQLRRRAAI